MLSHSLASLLLLRSEKVPNHQLCIFPPQTDDQRIYKKCIQPNQISCKPTYLATRYNRVHVRRLAKIRQPLIRRPPSSPIQLQHLAVLCACPQCQSGSIVRQKGRGDIERFGEDAAGDDGQGMMILWDVSDHSSEERVGKKARGIWYAEAQ